MLSVDSKYSFSGKLDFVVDVSYKVICTQYAYILKIVKHQNFYEKKCHIGFIVVFNIILLS